jgi:hypothetical protein
MRIQHRSHFCGAVLTARVLIKAILLGWVSTANAMPALVPVVVAAAASAYIAPIAGAFFGSVLMGQLAGSLAGLCTSGKLRPLEMLEETHEPD